ncbi:MAG: hypothetical protein HY534_00565 [Chloroflexi bacterium]|nr:hypothetical protein [Chloroflexota bacterium]
MAIGEPFTGTELASNLSVEFTLLSGETISVRDNLTEPVTEDAIRKYAEELVRQLQSDTVRTFAYWWAGDFYVDAVRLREVAALSVSPVTEDDDSENWEEGE